MITTKNKSEIIEQYFKGQLDQDIRDEFLIKYVDDEIFRKEVDEYKLITQTFRHLSPESEEKIQDFLKLKGSKNKTISFNFRNYRVVLAAAASIAIVVSISVYFFTGNKTQQNQQISKTKVYSIPLYHPNNLGFNQNDPQSADSMPLVMKLSKDVQGYYQFTDTLFLQLATEPNKIQAISLTKTSTHFVLKIDSVKYLIRQGFKKPQKLEEIND